MILPLRPVAIFALLAWFCGTGAVMARPWTEGGKKILALVVYGSDEVPEKTEAQLQAEFDNSLKIGQAGGLDEFWRRNSGGKMWITEGRVRLAILPNPASYYVNMYTLAMGDALTVTGENPSNYQFIITARASFPSGQAIAYVGSSYSYFKNLPGAAIMAHELGHNLGLYHANMLGSSGSDPLVGSNWEYANSYDVMSSNLSGFGDYNSLFKTDLDWLTANATNGSRVLDVTASGTYRLTAHDAALASGGNRALRVLKVPGQYLPRYFYIDYRQVQWASNFYSWNGVHIHTDMNSENQLLDMNPGTLAPMGQWEDAPLLIGRTFHDAALGMTLTPLDKVAGSNPPQIDVRVNFGPFTGNQPPASGSITATNPTPAAGQATSLTANATDPNGDALAYSWDFGDGTFSTSSNATQTKSWPATGIKQVLCTVSDMKGGTATATYFVNVGNIPHRTPDAPAATLAGVAYRYYELASSTLPDWGKLLPRLSGTLTTPSISPRLRNDDFAFIYEGYLNISASGIYSFQIRADDGFRFKIGGQTLLENNRIVGSAETKTAFIGLQAGLHAFTLEYFHKDGGETLDVRWGPGGGTLVPLASGDVRQLDHGANAAPVVAITSPEANAGFLVGSDVQLTASATDADGIAKVQYFDGSSYLGEAAAAPFTVTWPNVSIGTRAITAVAYDTTGRWAASAPVAVEVFSPPPRPSFGVNFNPESQAGADLAATDMAGAVYPQANWTNLKATSGTQANLPDYLGLGSGAAIAWSGTTNTSYVDSWTNADTGTAAGRLFRGILEIRGNENPNRPTATFTSVPYLEYDVYVYFDMKSSYWEDAHPIRFELTAPGAAAVSRFGQNAEVAPTGVDYPQYGLWVGHREAVATSETAPIAQRRGNYVVFRGVAGPQFTVTAQKVGSGDRRVGISAIQVVQAPATSPRIYVLESDGTTAVGETGQTDAYSIVLGYAPTAPVTITIQPGAQLATDKASVVFTPANWNQPQSVVVSAIDDTASEGPHSADITHVVSSSGNYNGITARAVAVSISDNDQPTVSVGSTGSPAESGRITGKFKIVRSGVSSLAAPLTVAFQLGGTASTSADYTLTGSVLTFNTGTGAGSIVIPANQAVAEITLTPVADSAAEGVETVTLTLPANAAYALGSPASAGLGIADAQTPDYYTQSWNNYNDLSGEGWKLDAETVFDLAYKKATFTPDGSTSYYSLAIETAAAFPTGALGTALHGGPYTKFEKDSNPDWGEYWTVTSMPTKFFGTTYNTIYVNADGYICFGSTDDLGDPIGPSGQLPYQTHFMKKRLSAFWKDMWDPGTAGAPADSNVYVNRITASGQQRTVVTYSNMRVATATATDRANVQVEFWDSGFITITWLACASTDNTAFVGLSNETRNGSSLPTGFVPTNFSAYAPSGSTAPVFATTPPLAGTSGAAYSYLAAASDLDGPSLVFTTPAKPAWLTLTDHGNGTATLAGTPPAPGSYAVTLRVSDGANPVDQSFFISVAPAGGNTAPGITSTAATAINAGATFSYTATATDPDGQSLAWSAPIRPSWLTLTDHGNGTATLAGTAPDTAVAVHDVVLNVSDGLSATSQAFSITINRAPTIRLDSPTTAQADIPAGVGVLLRTTVSDDNATPALAWSRVSGPGVATFESPNADDTAVTFSASGTYVLRLTANDGAFSATRDITINAGTTGAVGAQPTRAWWKFDEATGTSTADATGSGNTGTLVNTPGRPAGKFGNALQFNGTNQRVDVANSSSLQITGNLTIAFWIRRDVVGSAQSGARVLSKKSAWNSAGGYELELGNGASEFHVLAGGNNWAKASGLAWTTNWHHVAAVISGTTCQVYFDGAAMTMSDGVVGALASDNNLLRLGASGAATPGNFFAGALDDVRLFNRVLTVAEIQELATAVSNTGANVDAGASGLGQPGQGIALQGTMSDDGLPASPGAVALSWSRVSGPGAVNFTSLAGLATTATFDTPGEHRLRLVAHDGHIQTFDDTTVAIENPPAANFAAWIAGQTGVGAATAPGDDADGDGVPNLLEFAFGTAPNSHASRPGFESQISNFKVQLTFTPAVTQGLRFHVDASSDLSDWSDTSDITNLLTPGTPYTHTDRASLSTSPRRFLRLRIELQ